MNALIIIFATFQCAHPSHSARILGIFHVASHSHHVLESKLMTELALRGHEVTVISGFVPKHTLKNYTTVELTGSFEAMQEAQKSFFQEESLGRITAELALNSECFQLTEDVFKQPTVQQLIKSNQKFDVVIVEEFYSYALKGFCYHFNAPCISSCPIGASRFTNSQVGNPSNPSYIPDFSVPFGSFMSFFERLQNSFISVFGQLYLHLYAFPRHNKVLQKFFPGAPHISQLHYNVSLALVNGHVSSQHAIPLVPNMIEIGGFHVTPPKQLPSDLQSYLDDAKNGAIYFSMGSNLRSVDMPEDKLKAILGAFGKLNQKVLWKWEEGDLPGKPNNVKIEKWLPQSDVLAHPNVKLFVTHGGLLSTMEAIYHGVPIVGIPIFGDHKMNLQSAVSSGLGLGLSYSTLNQDELLSTIQEVLSNPKYRDNAQRRSKIMHDQPMKPLDKAMFWIEYVIRHRGAPHLRSAALNLAWYQCLLLDVALFVFVVTISLIFGLCFVIRKLICSKKRSQKLNAKKKKN